MYNCIYLQVYYSNHVNLYDTIHFAFSFLFFFLCISKIKEER